LVPTWGDTIVVSPVEDGLPTWDRDGVPWAQIGTRIVADGGRWAMIVDYVPDGPADDEVAHKALSKACEAHGIVCEGAWGPRDDDPGRVYLAVKNDVTAHAVMTTLEQASLPCALLQIHPEPKRERVAAKKPAAKPEPKSEAKKRAPKKAATKPAVDRTRRAPTKKATARKRTKS